MKSKKLRIVKLAFLTVFLLLLVLPLIKMFSMQSIDDIKTVISSARFKTSTMNSLLVTVVATIISVGLATTLAWCMARNNIKLKGLWGILFLLPMLIPSISHGTGLIVLFGTNGVFTNLFGMNTHIYGFLGIVIGSVMYSFPVAYIMIYDILKYENSTTYDAASILGISKFRQFTAITLPYLRKPMIAVVFSVFTLIITDYGVPLMVGGQFSTLPTMMYQDVIGLLDFGKGSVVGLVLIIPALIAFLLDLTNKDEASSSFTSKPFNINKNKLRNFAAYTICIATSIFVLLPIVVFVALTFIKKYPIDMTFTLNNIISAFDMDAGKYLANSLVIAICVSVIGVIFAYIVAYLTARTRTKLSKTLHLVSIISLAVPGLVLGLSYVLFFKTSFIYGTLAILILVNIMHFFSSPYLMMYNTFNKLNSNLELVGETLGISRIRIIFKVLIPQSRATIAEMFAYFFVNSMMTISAISFLAVSANKPLSLLINTLEAQMLIESIAFVSIIILVVNLLLKGIIYLYKNSLTKRDMI